MKVLVTGGAGFIGSHLCERLLGDGHQVTIVDDLNDYYSPGLKRENLASVKKRGDVAFHWADITDEKRVFDIVEAVRPEAIVHLAGRAGVRPSLEQPLLYEKVNIYGTTVLLEASRQFGVKKFVFASSSSVYGIADQVPFRERTSANKPISPYAATKLAGEQMCFTYSHLYRLSAVCLRFFTVYGPRQRPDLAIRKFVEKIDAGETIPVFGDGSMARDYTFVADTVSGIRSAMEYDCGYDIFNLGNSSPVSLMTLIRTIEGAVGKQAFICWLPEQAGDVPITFADISHAQRHLGYSPGTALKEGIARFVQWHRRIDAWPGRGFVATALPKDHQSRNGNCGQACK